MTPPLSQYIKYEIWPRRRLLCRPAHLTFLLLVGATVAWLGPAWFNAHSSVGDLTLGLISYTSFSLGFCLAGLVVALTLPDRDFVDFLIACPSHASHDKNAYSDLLFVFSWTAVVHWITVIVLFLVMLFADERSPLVPAVHSWWRVGTVTAVAMLCLYCFMQFLLTLLTLSQIGELYVDLRHVRRAKAAEAAR